ncbi:hydantoinase/oxoprolinase family protein [Amycolatopsis sp.]|uniref:hydantoinase/oxoprolinase family protein n=1 Tax=Amycolatopsis sp. TaxID=37632 RepID=UPI002CB21823|nr:hydantoinase/oxoprolinase family protein [Amycolatopsis sp.]HVV11455.1 hydantoinase/oxoprolinase family protein [Amycolatopsis sp.]
MGLRIGIDTGGTFTDLCLFDEQTREVLVKKVSSTPDDPGRAIVAGTSAFLAERGAGGMGDIVTFAHGTTVGTNALLTHAGVRTGLVTTRGFRDLLELGRGHRPSMYDLQADKPVPFVSRKHRLEVTERVRYDGSVQVPLDPGEVEQIVDELEAAQVRSVAVCLLYSFLYPRHERLIAEAIRRRLPDVYVSVSSDVLPEFREYERLSTVVTNAYIGPVVANYLARLRSTLSAAGLAAVPHVTQSNGGIIPFTTAEELPVKLVLSGPSTGVVGAAAIAAAAGLPDIITFDMGGTSSDVSLVQGGEPKLTSGMELDGVPVRSQMLDIHTVGAGGGSIAWVDNGGHLRVGPASAGAYPGPACYGNGRDATVTDANVVLGTLNPGYFLGGEIAIDAEASRRAVGAVGEQLGLSTPETAAGILQVVTANMARAIRVISVQRGYDPRDYVLVPFGGAGPLHVSRLARELGIRRILVPPTPGALSALGLLMTDVRADFTRTRIHRLHPDDLGSIAATFAELRDQAGEWFTQQGIDGPRRRVRRSLDMRYAGQNYELAVDVAGEEFDEAGLVGLTKTFEAAHEQMYGYSAAGEGIEVVTFRVQAIASVPHVELSTVDVPEDGADVSRALAGHRDVYLSPSTGFRPCAIYRRALLRPGDRIAGPAIVEQMDTTTIVMPGDTCSVDSYANLIIESGDEHVD